MSHRLVSFIVLILLTLSCGTGAKAPTQQQLIDCATVDVGKTVPEIGVTIVADVLQILAAGSSGWESALGDIAVKYGEDTLACSLKVAHDSLTAHPPNTRPAPPSEAAQRASSFIAKKGYSYK